MCGVGMPILEAYMLRHIQVDEGEHGPMAKELLEAICGQDRVKWCEVADVAAHAIRARIALWDAARERLPHRT
jgi:hypothetical protein